MNSAPVITIDGPSGSGKGTVSRLVAHELGWHFLDSGALYRLVALAARRHAIPFSDEQALERLALGLDVEFVFERKSNAVKILLEGQEVSATIRLEECGSDASKVAALPIVRSALLERQRAFCQLPGLVADGRDMGTVVFCDADLKIFLTASLEERASRRYKQLKEQGVNGSIDVLLDDLARRDERDMARTVAPLKPADDAVVVDTTGVDIATVVADLLEHWQQSCR